MIREWIKRTFGLIEPSDAFVARKGEDSSWKELYEREHQEKLELQSIIFRLTRIAPQPPVVVREGEPNPPKGFVRWSPGLARKLERASAKVHGDAVKAQWDAVQKRAEAEGKIPPRVENAS